MAEPVIGGNGSKPPNEMSMEVRLLLAFVLMGAVMFVSQYFLKSQAPPVPQKTARTTEKSNEKSTGQPGISSGISTGQPGAVEKDAPSEPEAKAAPAPGATPAQ